MHLLKISFSTWRNRLRSVGAKSGICGAAVLTAGFFASAPCTAQETTGTAATTAVAGSKVLDTATIDETIGVTGTMNAAEGVYKVSIPRTDVKVTIDGDMMPPFMGLTSWAAFKPGAKAEAMVMGDLVLFQDEVNPVMSALFEAGLDVTALHNHFFFDDPKVYFMHIAGENSVEELARGVRTGLDAVKQIRSKASQPGKSFGGNQKLPASSAINAAEIDEILGTKGQSTDGMYKAVIGRTVKIPCGCEVGKEMGVNTWAAFMGSNDNAVVDGDFVTFDGELQPVLRALRNADINVVAIHNHMEGETPQSIFLHYWGRGPAAQLARGVKSALDAQKAATARPADDEAADGRMKVMAAGDATAAMPQQQMKPTLFPLEEMVWKDGPASLPKGAKFAVLEGDPAKEGPFVFRVKVPDGYRVPPHTHPKTERISVIAGALNIGMGEKFDEQAMQPMPAGTYGFWPAGMKHFVSATGETILQFHGTGPWTIHYVNPADDPRKSAN